MIAPTMTMPWIAFVPDISGVCSSVGTFEITSMPRKMARIRTVSSTRNWLCHQAATRFLRHAGAGGDLVVPVELQLAVGREVLEQREHVARVELARVGRHRARQVEQADDRDAVDLDDLAGHGQLAVAAGLGGEVDDHRARAHAAHGRRRDQPRRGPAGDRARS